MIEWKEYNKNNPPELGKSCLITNESGSLAVAELEHWPLEEEYTWVENRELIPLVGITHYAEINLPLQSVDLKEGDRVKHIRNNDFGTILEVRNVTAWVKYDNGYEGSPHLISLSKV